MNEPCRREADVIRAANEGAWSDALRMHLTECEQCAAAAAVAPWLDKLSKAESRERPLPDPAVVWMKARLLGQAAAVERASRPLHALLTVAYLVIGSAWAALLTWKWNALERWLLSFLPWNVVQHGPQSAPVSMTLLATVLLLSSMTIAVALHTMLADE